MRVRFPRFALELQLMRLSIGDCLQCGGDLPEVCLIAGMYSASHLLPNGTTLRIAVRADDRKAHLCVTDSKGGRGCLTGNSLSQIKGTVKHLKADPSPAGALVSDLPTHCPQVLALSGTERHRGPIQGNTVLSVLRSRYCVFVLVGPSAVGAPGRNRTCAHGSGNRALAPARRWAPPRGKPLDCQRFGSF